MEQVEQPTESQHTIRNHLAATIIDGHHTDVGVFQFEDKLFVVLTQFEKIGTLVIVTPAKVVAEDTTNPVYQIKVLLGKDEVKTHAFARFLAEKLNLSQPLLIGMALKQTTFSPAVAKKVVNFILDGIQKIS